MKSQIKLMAAAGLLCSVAMPAMAQTANDQANRQANAQTGSMENCDRLAQLADENRDRFRPQWLNNADRVAQRDDQEACMPLVTQAERAAETMDRREAANRQGQNGDEQVTNRIVVEQPDPRVTVEQDSPQITYSQPRAQVSVDQGQPQIIVRQQQPTINVEMPRPTITINQPEPEIIVRMPEPDVAVNVPEPEINVSQDQPDVTVNQPDPQVSLQMEEANVNVQGGDDEAEVSVERSQPVVRREGEQQQARVNVEQNEPQVRFEPAEPNIEFQGNARPQVEYNRTGEPTVRFEQAQTDDAQGGQNAARNAGQQQAAADAPNTAEQQPVVDEERTASVGNEGISEDVRNRLRGNEPGSGQLMPMSASELIGREVVNRQGDTLGEVERVVAMNQRPYVVLSHGGFFGLGEREVALPLDRISSVRNDDELVMRGLSEEDIDALPRFDADRAQQLRPNQQVQIDES